MSARIRTTTLALSALFAVACDGAATTNGATDTTQPEADTTTTADTAVAPDTGETVTADTATPGDTGAASEDTTGPVEPPPIIATAVVDTGEWPLASGKEKTRCVVKRLDNAAEMWVTQVRTELGSGSHHMIIYVSDETEERAAPFDCDPFIETLKGQTYPIMITQIKKETLTFPTGIAFRFKPNQMIRLEAHFINYLPNEITAHGEVYFDGIAADRVTDEANLLFYGNPDFEIPAGQSYTTPWRFIDVPAGTRIFAVTGHEHRMGTNVEISYADGPEDEGQSIYPAEGDEFSWDEPPVEYFDPPLEFAAGQGVRYRCSWDNTTNQDIGFGESANSEMCFLWAYYYPSQGYRLCVNPGGIGGGVAGDQVCCPGHWVCDYINQFL